jgi:hypothetical protein
MSRRSHQKDAMNDEHASDVVMAKSLLFRTNSLLSRPGRMMAMARAEAALQAMTPVNRASSTFAHIVLTAKMR